MLMARKKSLAKQVGASLCKILRAHIPWLTKELERTQLIYQSLAWRAQDDLLQISKVAER